jgi:hypothetical protein
MHDPDDEHDPVELSILFLSGEGVLKPSVFGISPEGKLPPIIPGGHWLHYRKIREDRFKLAAEAKKSVAEHGYYVFGGQDNADESAR